MERERLSDESDDELARLMMPPGIRAPTGVGVVGVATIGVGVAGLTGLRERDGREGERASVGDVRSGAGVTVAENC